MQRERPIIFNGESVRAILDGRKTMTRRVVKPQPHAGVRHSPGGGALEDGHGRPLRCPYGQPGDRLWVREMWRLECPYDDDAPSDLFPGDVSFIDYKADAMADRLITPGFAGRWRSSLHMPRWACRLVLEVEEVRVERLQEISDEDCEAEGVRPSIDGRGGSDWRDDESGWRRTFRHLWDELNADRGFPWSDNPWVWVVSFRVEHP